MVRYRPEIDGLRAVAVLGVLVYHAQIPFRNDVLLSGGYVGVDVFFVISGFLITKILVGDLGQKSFSLRRFYDRRIRRILPALLVVMIASAPFAYALMMPKAMREYALSSLSALGFVSNFYFLFEDSYFAEANEVNPFLHTWSLAVEEQFYLFFPPLLWALWKWAGRHVFWIVLALAIVSLAAAQLLSAKHAELAFYAPATRIWELFVGALLALKVADDRAPLRRWLNGALTAAGLALIAASMVAFGKHTPHPSLLTLAPVVGAALLIACSGPGDWSYRILASAPVVGVGRISYSLYLWHYPVFAFGRIWLGTPSVIQTLALAGLAIGLSVVTYLVIEQPFRDRRRMPAPAAYAAIGLAALVVCAGAYVGFYKGAFVQLRIQSDPFFAAVQRATDGALLQENTACRFYAGKFDAETEAKVLQCLRNGRAGTLIIGDSHAIDVFNMLNVTPSDDTLIVIAQGDCLSALPEEGGDDKCNYRGLIGALRDAESLKLSVIYVQAGHHLFNAPGHAVGGRWLFAGVKDPPHYALNEAYAAHIAAFLNDVAAVAPTIWLGPRLEPYMAPDKVLAHGCRAPFALSPALVENFRALDRAIASAISGARFRYVSEQDAVAIDPARDVADCDAIYFSDADHYSPAGERRFAPRLLAALAD